MRSAQAEKTWLSRSGTSTPTRGPVDTAPGSTLLPWRRAISMTDRLVASLTPDLPLSTRETVASLTPASRAISMSRAIPLTLPDLRDVTARGRIVVCKFLHILAHPGRSALQSFHQTRSECLRSEERRVGKGVGAARERGPVTA